jgi:hypothetical protein
MQINVYVGKSEGPANSSQPAPEAMWKPPSLFEVVKEQNAHARGLLAGLGLVSAASTFSVANGAVHDALMAADKGFTYGMAVIALILLALNLMLGFLSASSVMEPAIPIDINSEPE